MNHLQQHRQQSQSQSQSQPQLPTPPPLQHHGRNLRSSTNAVLKLEPKITTASISNTIKPEDTLTGTLRQQLLHRFKLFAIKLKVENMNRENGDFYEQCFNFMGNLIMSNIQGVNKEMFSMTSNTSKPTLILKTSPAPATQPIDTIKREDNSIFIKKFSCNNCDATFPSLRHLERHSVQHTGEKPHICEVIIENIKIYLFIFYLFTQINFFILNFRFVAIVLHELNINDDTWQSIPMHKIMNVKFV